MKNKDLLKRLTKPVAITMWDFSWLLSEDFGDIEQALDQLILRGYNAVRIDIFPTALSHFLRTGQTSYTYPGSGAHAIWGNKGEVTVNTPAMVEKIMRGCIDRGIYIGLSTWVRWSFQENAHIDLDGIKSVWCDAITFLEQHGLMQNILYIDLMNEYPCNHAFTWIYCDAISKQRKALTGSEHVVSLSDLKFDSAEAEVWRGISADLMDYFHLHYPQYDFTLSFVETMYDHGIEKYLCAEKMDTLDAHQWFAFHPELSAKYNLGIFENNEPLLIRTNTELERDWLSNHTAYVEWLDSTLCGVAAIADKYGITAGNTEGWGMVGWKEYSSVGWEFIKRSAELCIPLCKKHTSFKYITTSNFTHPFFPSLWNDVDWHKRVTDMIKE